MELLGKKVGDSAWLVNVLYCLDREHRIFGRDYIYEKKRQGVATMPLLNNEDGFFDGLPQLS